MSKPLAATNEFLSQIFKGLVLAQQEISGKLFEECQFTDCNFTETSFSQCKFLDCSFVNCNLSNAKVTGSKFLNVEFTRCKAIGINWTRASWPRVAVNPQLQFHHSIINDCSFFGLKLEEIVLRDCKAHSVDFRDANIARADLIGTDLLNSLFGKTTLTEADFTNAFNYVIDVLDNQVQKARFSRHEAFGLLTGLNIELVD